MSEDGDGPYEGRADNVVYLSSDQPRKQANSSSRRGVNWTSRTFEYLEIDLCANPKEGHAKEFISDEAQFRVYFEHALLAEMAHSYFGIMTLSMAQFVTERPPFSDIIVEFDAIVGRFFVGSLLDRVCFYCEFEPEVGLLLPLAVPGLGAA